MRRLFTGIACLVVFIALYALLLWVYQVFQFDTTHWDLSRVTPDRVIVMGMNAMALTGVLGLVMFKWHVVGMKRH